MSLVSQCVVFSPGKLVFLADFVIWGAGFAISRGRADWTLGD